MNMDDPWIDQSKWQDLTHTANALFSDQLQADEDVNNYVADCAYDAGFEAGVEAQKHGLGIALS